MILVFFFLNFLLLCQQASPQKNKNSNPTLNDGVDRHAVFSQSLNDGVYNFTSDGHIRKYFRCHGSVVNIAVSDV